MLRFYWLSSGATRCDWLWQVSGNMSTCVVPDGCKVEGGNCFDAEAKAAVDGADAVVVLIGLSRAWGDVIGCGWRLRWC